ncbi:HNH endonuclease [uncultured Methanobrevibacter sp.]|uniref:HNH endonuclease n=1 Tax=uncultured Methanobrevibacter sp. TaxID=253161 RepID=UPI0037430CC4
MLCFMRSQPASGAHHVFSFKNFVPLRLDLDNGITLCHWCHKKYHAFYNLENTNPVNEYFYNLTN